MHALLLSSLRYLTEFIRGCKIIHAACGGVTHWAIAQEETGVMTIAFGQGALNGLRFLSRSPTVLSNSHLSLSSGELGHGPDQPKSATKPIQNMPLAGIDVIQCVHKLDSLISLFDTPPCQPPELPRGRTRRSFWHDRTKRSLTSPAIPSTSTHRISASSVTRTTATTTLP